MNRSAYIPLHGDVFNNKKTIEAANNLTNGSVERMVGHLARLWTWTIERNDDGDLSHLTDRMIADAAGWRRGASRFVDGITRAGFLEADRRLHDWDDFAGRLVDQRERDRDRKRRERQEAKESGRFPATAGGRPTDSPRDIRTQLTRPERNGTERREDADANASGQVSGGRSSPSGNARGVDRLTERQVIETSRMLLGNDGWPLDLIATRTLLDALAKENFPEGDLADALCYYDDLLENSPLEAKTPTSVAKAMRPWLASWLKRSHLSTLMDRTGRDRASELLNESVLGTDQYSEMSNSDVDYAIELLESTNTSRAALGFGDGALEDRPRGRAGTHAGARGDGRPSYELGSGNGSG